MLEKLVWTQRILGIGNGSGDSVKREDIRKVLIFRNQSQNISVFNSDPLLRGFA